MLAQALDTEEAEEEAAAEEEAEEEEERSLGFIFFQRIQKRTVRHMDEAFLTGEEEELYLRGGRQPKERLFMYQRLHSLLK